MSTSPTAVRQDKYHAEKATFGGITLVTMHGTVNEAFEGRKLAASIRTKKLLVNMLDVRRFASWGMSEWMDFLRVTADCDLYLVECSTYSLSQLNLVTGLLGHAKLVSFYASYRCGACSAETQTLFVIPRDRATIRDIPGSYHECPTCGSRAQLEEYPAAFFDTIAARPTIDIDDEVLAFMRSRLHYDLSPDLTRFRAYRRAQKGYTYLRLTGNIATLPPDALVRASAATTVVDVEGVVCERGQTSGWRKYVQATLATSDVRSLQLLGCPPGFLEAAVRVEDLHDKLKVRTFAMTYRCGTCETMSSHVIDVALNLEQLVLGTLPAARCPACRSPVEVTPTAAEAALLRALPARDRDAALDSLLTKARAEPADKLENCLATIRAEPATPRPKRRLLYAASGLGVLVIAATVMTAIKLSNQRSEAGPTTNPALTVTPPPRPTFTRPDWIISDVPSSAYCHDMINRLMCVGISSYRTSKDDGVSEATDAALEELVSTVGLKISDPFFRDTVMPSYSETRNKALSALQAASLDRTTDPKAAAAYTAANDAVRKARKRAVEVLQASGGAAVPAQRSDWYWEEYASESGNGTEFLVFVRFDVSVDAVRTLVDKYSATTEVMGSSAMTAFPGLAWRLTHLTGGAFMTKVGHPLAAAGMAAEQIVVAVGEQRVTDASGFAHRVEDSPHGELKLTVATGDDAPEKVINVKR